jgi:hypothetical protein
VNPIVPPLPATLAGLVVLLGPGLLLLALLPAREREELPLDERLYLVVGVSVAASAWLALVLAELGRFSLVGAALVLVVSGAALALLLRGRLAWPLQRPARWAALAPAALVVTLAVALQARPSQYLVGGRDPGAYIAAMGMIGRSGGIVYTDPAVLSIPPEDVQLFFRNPSLYDFSWSRFMGFDLERPQSGRVFPQFFHLFPAFGAFLFQAMGVKGALATSPLFGILGTLGAFFTFRRLFGPAVALLGAVLLASNVVQVWFARFPVSESVSQFLLFLALFGIARWEERGSPVFAALAGAALGLTLLVRIDSALVVAPLGVYVLLRRARRELDWRGGLALLLPFALLLLHASLHAALYSRKYVLSIVNRTYWGAGTWTLALVGFGCALLAAERLGPPLWHWLERHQQRLRAAAGAAVVALALYAYFVRPELSALAGAPGNRSVRSLTNFGALDLNNDNRLSYEEFARRADNRRGVFDYYDENHDGLLTRVEWGGDAPPWLAWLGFGRLAAHDAQAFYRLGWFVSPLGLLLGVLGLLHVFRHWRAAHLFPILTALTFALFYLYKVRVWHDYYFALRRFVPVVIPFLLAFGALWLVALGARPGWRRALAVLLGVALELSFLRDTRTIAWYTDWNNAVRFVADVSRRFTPQDVVIFEQPRSIHLLSLPLWAVHGVNALELARFDPDPARLQHLFQAWRGRYRNIYFVHTYRTDLCGVFLQGVEDHVFGTQEWERTYDRPPRRPEARSLSFRVSRVIPPDELRVPALPELDVGGSDDFVVSGFHGKEGGGEHTYRWTGACASVYLPGARPGATLAITASVGERPPDAPATVTASLSATPLGRFEVGADWEQYRLTLPDPLPPGPPVLRLDVPPFRPINLIPGSRDPRDLGIMLDRIRILAQGDGSS